MPYKDRTTGSNLDSYGADYFSTGVNRKREIISLE